MIYNRYIGTKLVRPFVSSGYQEVDVYANLPAANTESGNTYLVRQDTVTVNTSRLENGLYRSNGITWVYLGLSQPEILTNIPSKTDEIHALSNKAVTELFERISYKKTIALANGAVNTDIPELSFDGAINPFVRISFLAKRKSDTPYKATTRFDLLMEYENNLWTYKRHYDYLPDGKTDGITFSITTAAGIASVKYSSTTITGVYDAAASNFYLDIFPQWPLGGTPFSLDNSLNFKKVSDLIKSNKITGTYGEQTIDPIAAALASHQKESSEKILKLDEKLTKMIGRLDEKEDQLYKTTIQEIISNKKNSDNLRKDLEMQISKQKESLEKILISLSKLEMTWFQRIKKWLNL